MSDELAGGDHCGGYDDSNEVGAAQAVVASGTVVVADDGLHALTDADDEKSEERSERDEDARGGDCGVSAIGEKTLVDEHVDETRGGIDERGSRADGDD